MSRCWNIRCVTCEVTEYVGINHGDAEMRLLIKHAQAIAALAPLFAEAAESRLSLDLHAGIACGIDPMWFAAHRGHELRPIDEYGVIDGKCTGYVTCDCGGTHNCKLQEGHEGPHRGTA